MHADHGTLKDTEGEVSFSEVARLAHWAYEEEECFVPTLHHGFVTVREVKLG